LAVYDQKENPGKIMADEFEIGSITKLGKTGTLVGLSFILFVTLFGTVVIV
jgi:hypothetical protein